MICIKRACSVVTFAITASMYGCFSLTASNAWAEPYDRVNVVVVPKLTLRGSILRSFSYDPSIAQYAAQLGIGQAQLDEAKSAWRPQVSLGGNVGGASDDNDSGALDDATSYGLTVTQLLYDFDRTGSAIKQNEMLLEGYRAKLQDALNDTASRTAIAYIDIKRNERSKKSSEDVNRPGFPRHFPGSVNVASQTLPVTAGC